MPAPIAALAARKLAAAAARRAAARAVRRQGGGGHWKKVLLAGIAALCAVAVAFITAFGAIVGILGAKSAEAACLDDASAQQDATGVPGGGAYSPIMPGEGIYLPSDTARAEIPPRMLLAAIRAAARYPGLDWTLIAGQMYQETRYGQHPSAAPGGDNGFGYKGILQFGDPAWQGYGDDGNGDKKKDRYSVEDAAFAAANYLHALKAESDSWNALRRYSGSTVSNTTYMRVVTTQSARYRGVFSSDTAMIKSWQQHLADTIKKNPSFPVLGKAAGIPEPVNDFNAKVTNAAQIKSAAAKPWSTPPHGQVSAGSNAPVTQTSTPPPAGTAAGPTAAGWQWPMKKGTYTFTAQFGQSGGRWSAGHTGIDLAGPTGTRIYAPAAGKVISAANGGAYGNLTKIEHAGGIVTFYAHQSSISVTAGQQVKRGTHIGDVGATGNVTGPHLHWEVRKPGVRDPHRPGQNNGPGPIDPKDWMSGKTTADPTYGNEQYAQAQQQAQVCATDTGGAIVIPDGAGATGPLPAADSEVVRAALAWAQTGLGKPYLYGARRLQGDHPADFDCSSFTQWAYYQASGGKLNIGGDTTAQLPKLSKHKVPADQVQAGDLVFYGSKSNPVHVAMVWDPSTKKVIHAANSKAPVKFGTWSGQKDPLIGFYRVEVPSATTAVGPNGGTSEAH
ncbi:MULTISPECIES: peptidoglycan DD-metalloendopeptidase family protein [unclassified Streptomyces]|uniref:peptidoglycan DD-metalloendopeptidase family protein n=1 Tax=unclassified Streptomyces TaxID=2593676 RepID=UPI00379D667C